MPGLNEKINFSISLEEFKEQENKKGCFEGLLVKYQHENLAHGYYRFKAGSMKANEGKTMLLLYNHNNMNIPVGTCTGVDTAEGFKITAQLQLSTDEAGNALNKEAYALYDLMKTMGAKFELSAGGVIEEGETKEVKDRNGTKYYFDITKFNAHEGSITPRAAVKGSKITRVFSENEDGERGDGTMNKEELKKFMEEFFKNFKEQMFTAQTDEEVKKLPLAFKEMQGKFEEFKNNLESEIVAKYEQQFNELNEIIKGLKADYKPTAKDVSAAEQFKAMYDIIEKKGVGVSTYFNADETIQFTDAAAAGTTNTAAAIRPDYADTILERIQESNPVLKEISFISTNENSYFIPREMLGLPAAGWVGEEEERQKTEITKLDNVTINLYQLYVMPVISNKLLATNFIGYANFVLKRAEYAMGLALANSIFVGDGANKPKGILKDAGVTQVAKLDVTTDQTLQDSILDAYYSVRSEIAETAKWYMSRLSWKRIAQIKATDGRFTVTDLNKGSVRELMGRPVELIETENAGIKDIGKATADTDYIGIFANLNMAMLGLKNPNLDLRIEDKITQKGLTVLWLEKLIGVGVQLPEYIVKLVKKGGA